MIVGIPKEIKDNEKRVALTPSGASDLVSDGNIVYIEEDAGLGSGFTNKSYIKAGAIILDNPTDIFNKSEMIVKVKEPQQNEIDLITDKHTVFTYFHFAADRNLTTGIIDSGCTAIAYETVQLEDGSLPLLIPMSEVAGRMSVQNGAKCLEESMGGKGKLLGGVPGVDSSIVTILGGGIVGTNAAKLAAGLGAKVYILDVDLNRMRYLDDIMPSNVKTIYSNKHNIESLIKQTDLLIGAVLVVGSKAPKLITKDMLSKMQYGSVIVDVAVDQGGCVETCKPTTHENPTFVVDDILHYCVANMPGSVPHTSTLALTNVTLPYIKSIAKYGNDYLLNDYSIRKGINTKSGFVTHNAVAECFNLDYKNIDSII